VDCFDRVISTSRVNIILKYRNDRNQYINAFNNSCDVAIVDGKFRIDCVNKILDSEFLVKSGMVALMEAGRGSPNWWEGNLTGENDYTPVLNRMLELGGKIVDGDGVDNWQNINRKSPNPISYTNPMEACILIRT
jgi:hypothetical protein